MNQSAQQKNSRGDTFKPTVTQSGTRARVTHLVLLGHQLLRLEEGKALVDGLVAHLEREKLLWFR